MKAAVYCLDRMGARAVAIKALASFMTEHGESLSLVLMLGVLQYQEGALEKSAETFRKAVSLSPTDWRANRNLGMVYRKMGNDALRGEVPAEGARNTRQPPRRKPPGRLRRRAGGEQRGRRRPLRNRVISDYTIG